MGKSVIIALLGAALGGVLGYQAFVWILKYGFYAMILPGVLLGLGASFGRCRLLAIPILCGLAALALGLFTEWRTRPFNADKSLSYFLSHLQDLTPVTWIMVLAGGFLGFWIPFRARPVPKPHS